MNCSKNLEVNRKGITSMAKLVCSVTNCILVLLSMQCSKNCRVENQEKLVRMNVIRKIIYWAVISTKQQIIDRSYECGRLQYNSIEDNYKLNSGLCFINFCIFATFYDVIMLILLDT